MTPEEVERMEKAEEERRLSQTNFTRSHLTKMMQNGAPPQAVDVGAGLGVDRRSRRVAREEGATGLKSERSDGGFKPLEVA
jgi:hypothetical protein